DLHLTSAQATTEECAAVDSVLGVPDSARLGAQPPSRDTRVACASHPTRSERHNLLPVLHAIQSRIGWISPGALNYTALRVHGAPGGVPRVRWFYGCFPPPPRPPVVAHVCDDIACLTRGADQLCSDLEKRLGPSGSPSQNGRAAWLRSQCLGLCERAPAALV